MLLTENYKWIEIKRPGQRVSMKGVVGRWYISPSHNLFCSPLPSPPVAAPEVLPSHFKPKEADSRGTFQEALRMFPRIRGLGA